MNFSFLKKLSVKQKIALIILVCVFLVFSVIKTYFPKVGLSSWKNDINLVLNGKPNVAENKDLCVYFADVGQADCILIKTPDGNVIIDTGKSADAENTFRYILRHNIDKARYLVITHPHEDHYGGAARILDFVDVENIIMPQIPKSLYPDDDGFDYLVDKINRMNIPVYAARAGDTYSLGKAVFTVLSPAKDFDNLNDMSAVIRLDYGNTSFLFTGDAEKSVERYLVRHKANLKCDVLKISHHGSSTASTGEFLRAADPLLAVISSGLKNEYGHPADDVLYRLKKQSIDYLRPDLNGNIIIGSDGEKLYCSYEKGNKNG